MNKEFKKLLTEYIALKSISTDPAFDAEMRKTAEWLGEYLAEHGFKVSYLKGPRTNPVVYAEYMQSPELETVMVYGHYDVQPANKSDGWSSEPFTLTEKKGRLIGRGVVDNKGQNLIHVFTVCDLIKQNSLKYNVKFMIEGNEETANPDMEAMVKKYKKLFKSDAIIISDGEIQGTTPTIEASLRGGFNMTVTLTTGKNNLHSGLAGGVAPSASHELSRLIAKFYGSDNKVAIPGFYEGVKKLTNEELSNTKKTGTVKEIMELFGVKTSVAEKGMNPYAQIGLRPTIQISGIKSGYIAEGYANIVPATAEARINVRVVGGQDPQKIYDAIVQFVKKEVPGYVKIDITRTDMNSAVAVDVTQPRFVAVRKLLKTAYKKEPIIKYVGGSIPIVSDFKETLGIDTLLVSLGNDDCNMHGVDENFRIDLIEKGLAFSRSFFVSKNRKVYIK
ncbi:MAG: M20/M25/M40 family metallo-hydrolase [Candidatus Pacebacteria bacterium]|nr:M20/M25/M40 family metallo-hydrolase [Candidatus Paceibacterota bacterium]